MYEALIEKEKLIDEAKVLFNTHRIKAIDVNNLLVEKQSNIM